jgi:hypothetical protein
MNKTFIKLFFLMPMALFLMSLTSSCSRFSHRNILSCDSLKYDSTATVNKIKIQCHLLVDYPTSGNKYLLQNIKEWINENVETPYLDKLSDGNRLIHFYGKCITDTLIAEARSFNSEAPELFRDITIRKAYETKKYVTYIINYSSYDGGAHGSSSVSGATFRKSDGRKFGMDMFTLGGYYEIKDLIKEGLKGYFNAKSDEQLKESLLDGNDVYDIPAPTTSPYLLKDGIHFVYQEYEIACYAAGMPEFTVPYDKIKDKLSCTVQLMLEEDKE